MPASTTAKQTARSSGAYANVERMLGAKNMHIDTPIDLHERITEGFPRRTLVHVVEGLRFITPGESLKALNMSARTWHRMKSDRQNPMPLDADQSSRVWNLAEVLSKAEEVLGDREEAEHWLAAPAIGLSSRRPIDLMASPQGAELVKTLLNQMAYGVYA